MTQPAIWQSFTQGFLRRLPTMDWLLSIGIPMGLQFSITAIGTIIVQGAVNAFGSVYIAGFSAAGKIQNIVSTVFVTFGAAAATYVGPRRGPHGPGPSGSQVHPAHDSGLERCDDSGVAAWLAALIPIVPYYFYKISRISREETRGGTITADVI